MKKLLKCFNIFTLFLILGGIVIVFNGCDKFTSPAGEEISSEQKDFNLLVEKIDELEKLSYQYNSEKYLDRVFIYVRSEKYNTQEWNSLGGEVDIDFVNYAFQNQTKDIESLRQLNSFVIPKTKESVDFVHMFATVNIIFSNTAVASYDLAGWGGDLYQLASSIKDCGKTGDKLYAYVKSIFNSSQGSFNAEDVCADIDAVNFANLLKAENKSIKDTFLSYYKYLSRKQTKQNFIQNVFGVAYTNLEDLQENIYSRVTKNNLLIFWGMKNNFNIKDSYNAEILKTCCNVFAEYLFNN